MLELGQPIHTFDYGILRARADRYAPGGPVRLETRLPRAGETLRTLDGTERRLEPNNILVSDPLGNLGLGGIMGGENSEISADTRDVLVEAAAWNFINIRRSARQLGLNTEASFRFSRGVHPAQTLLGARRAAELLRRYAGGTVAQGVVDHHPRPAPARTVVLDPREVARATGLKIDGSRIAELLRRLEFAVDRVDGAGGEGERLTVIAPDHRLDIEGPHDLVEEVCRMIGYENIPSTVLRDALPPQRGNPALEREERIRDALVAQGLREVITYRLTTPEAEARARVVAEERDYVRLANPSTAERVVLRYDLLASVLEIAAANARFQDRLALFEVGPVFPRRAGTVLPEELCRLAVVQSGAREGEHWSGGAAPHYDFFDLKGVLEDLASELKVSLAFTAGEHPSLRPGRTATVELPDGGAIGIAGELHPTVAERYGLGGAERPVLVAMLDLELLLPRIPETFGVAPVAVYPAVHEDVALVLESSVPASSVERALRAGGGELLREVELFDVFTGPQLGAGKRSLAYHLTYQAPDRTLTDREVERLRKRIVERAAREVGAVLRE
jgi:phenylalanyl-tRNA synthetase beta chain